MNRRKSYLPYCNKLVQPALKDSFGYISTLDSQVYEFVSESASEEELWQKLYK